MRSKRTQQQIIVVNMKMEWHGAKLSEGQSVCVVKCIHDRREFEGASVTVEQVSTGSKERGKVIGAVLITIILI